MERPAEHQMIDLNMNFRKKVAQIKKIIASKPSDFKTYKDLMFSCKTKNIELTVLEDKNFISSSEDFTDWAEGKKTRIQEYYYRWLRKKYNIFMDANMQPIGDQWNFDKDNRKKIPKDTKIPLFPKLS